MNKPKLVIKVKPTISGMDDETNKDEYIFCPVLEITCEMHDRGHIIGKSDDILDIYPPSPHEWVHTEDEAMDWMNREFLNKPLSDFVDIETEWGEVQVEIL